MRDDLGLLSVAQVPRAVLESKTRVASPFSRSDGVFGRDRRRGGQGESLALTIVENETVVRRVRLRERPEKEK